MTIYRIPEKLETIIFDIDSTLYTNESYAFEQNDVQIRQFAQKSNLSVEKAREMISSYRKEWEKMNDGASISLANTMLDFGVSIEESIHWRKELIHPENFLKEDLILQKTLKDLSKEYSLLCLTNNPVSVGRKTLIALGVDPFISEIVGLDTTKTSKPSSKPFETILHRARTAVESCLSVGDRYTIDIEVPLAMGMGGILIDTVKDVYNLKNIINFAHHS